MTQNQSIANTSTLPKGLPPELWKLILNLIEPDHEQAVPIDKAIASRQFLSVESFRPPDPRDAASNEGRLTIYRLRLVCHAFADLCAPSLFSHIVLRFTRKDLQRLDNIARCPHLARLVMRFTYMVPYFFHQGLASLDRFDAELRQEGLRSLNRIREKAHEQEAILCSKLDVEVVERAMLSFSSLQLVKLLPCTEHEERIALEYLNERPDTHFQVSSIWTSSLSHAGRSVSTRLLALDKTEPSRFILPFTTPGSIKFLKETSTSGGLTIAQRLTCLTLHFAYSEDLYATLDELSELFFAVFDKAHKMKAVHIGFPPQRPLTVPLESIFHHVFWPDLVAFGVQGWALEDAEIIELLARHQSRLRGVRLRDVHLKDDSTWTKILSFMREELENLEWLSLRRIGYSSFHHSLQQEPGLDMTMVNVSDSDSTDEDSSEEDEQMAEPSSQVESDSNEEEEDLDEDSDAEHGPHADDLEFPTFDPDTPASTWCSCHRTDDAGSVEALDDTDVIVSNGKRKAWERWVLRRCPEHDDT